MVTIVIMYVQMRGNVCGKAFLREWLVCVSTVVESKIIIKSHIIERKNLFVFDVYIKFSILYINIDYK